MSVEYTLNPQYKDSVHALRLHSIDQVFSLKADLIARSPISRVIRIEADGSHYYGKVLYAVRQVPAQIYWP
jgi:hypothetical protein